MPTAQEIFCLRSATADDLEKLHASDSEAVDGPAWSKALWLNVLQPSRAAVFRRTTILLEDKQSHIAGWVTGTLAGEMAELEFLFVCTSQRQRGLGRVLLAQWLKMTKMNGGAEAFLEVRASNVRAQKLYARFGFSVVGRRTLYYKAPAEDAIVMRLNWPVPSSSATAT